MGARYKTTMLGAFTAITATGFVTIAATGPMIPVEALQALVGQSRDIFRIEWPDFWRLLSSLFAIMNPLVAVPLFVSVTQGHSGERRKRLSAVTAFTVLAALTVAAIVGRELLGFFAISMASFRIAGGIIVLLMGLAMLQTVYRPQPGGEPVDGDADEGDSQAICPLAIPLLAGPGALATIILACEAARRLCDYTTIAAVIAVMVIAVYLTLRIARPIATRIGSTGLTVTTRIIGMVVTAIAVDMMAIGVSSAFPRLM